PAEVIRNSPDETPAKAPSQKPNLEIVNKPAPEPVSKVDIGSFSEAVTLFEKHREPLLYTRLKQEARLVSFAPGKIDLRMTSPQPRDFTAKVVGCLEQWTGRKWQV